MMNSIRSKVFQAGKSRIREEAIRRCKAKLALQGKTVDDFTTPEIEAIVAEEEKKVINSLKTRSLLGIIAILGLGAF